MLFFRAGERAVEHAFDLHISIRDLFIFILTFTRLQTRQSGRGQYGDEKKTEKNI